MNRLFNRFNKQFNKQFGVHWTTQTLGKFAQLELRISISVYFLNPIRKQILRGSTRVVRFCWYALQVAGREQFARNVLQAIREFGRAFSKKKMNNKSVRMPTIIHQSNGVD